MDYYSCAMHTAQSVFNKLKIELADSIIQTTHNIRGHM